MNHIKSTVASICGLAALFVALDFATAHRRVHDATVLPFTPVIPLGDVTTIVAEHNGHREAVTCTREEFLGLNTGDLIRVAVVTTGLTGIVISRHFAR